MIWIRVDQNLNERKVQLSRVPCVGERLRTSWREAEAVVYRVVHLEGEDVVAVVYLTSESGFAAMRREAATRRKPVL